MRFCKTGVCHVSCLLWSALFGVSKPEEHLHFAELLDFSLKEVYGLVLCLMQDTVENCSWTIMNTLYSCYLLLTAMERERERCW